MGVACCLDCKGRVETKEERNKNAIKFMYSKHEYFINNIELYFAFVYGCMKRTNKCFIGLCRLEDLIHVL